MYYEVATGTTYCPDTPENWRNFERKKAALLSRNWSTGGEKHRKTEAEKFNELLQKQISKENKSLGSLRRYLPGQEPDRFFDT